MKDSLKAGQILAGHQQAEFNSSYNVYQLKWPFYMKTRVLNVCIDTICSAHFAPRLSRSFSFYDTGVGVLSSYEEKFERRFRKERGLELRALGRGDRVVRKLEVLEEA